MRRAPFFTLLASSVFLAALLWPATADAQVGVLGFESTASTKKMARWVTLALRHWVQEKGRVLGPKKDGVEVKLVYGCNRGRASCMAQAAKAMKVRHLLFGKVRRRRRMYIVVIKHLDLKRPRNLDTLVRRVPVSRNSFEKVRDRSQHWFQKLIGSAGTGTLWVGGEPSGGILSIDGKVVGAIPFGEKMRVVLSAGRHTVSVKKEGYMPVERTVVIQEGRKKTLRIILRKAVAGLGAGSWGGTTPPKPRDKDPQYWWQMAFYTSLGLSAAMFVVASIAGYKKQQWETEKGEYLDDYQDEDWAHANNVCKAAPDNLGIKDSICYWGTTWADVATAFLVLGGVFAAGAAGMTYFAFFKDYETTAPPSRPGEKKRSVGRAVDVRLSPNVWKGGGGLTVRLDF
jgi:hypothetical protein